MATYVNDLRLKEIATGDESGTWGTSTNTNLELIGEALGYGSQDCFGSDANATTTVADGATDPARSLYFKVTSSATLSATRELTIAPNTVSRVMVIENATTGSQIITIKQGSGNTVNVANGAVKVLYLDGAGSGAAVQDGLVDLDLTGTTTAVTVTASGVITGLTVEATGDTAAGDNAAMGYTSAEGLILTGQGSSTDVTVKNDADATVMSIATGTTQATFAGEVVAASLDISGNIDVDGTTNLDAVDIDGAVQIDNTVTVGADDTGYDVKFFGATASAYMLWDESADDLKLVGAAGLTVAGDIDIDGTTNLDVVDIDGAVDMASTLAVGGVVTANAGVVVDNITIDGTEIDLSSGDLTLDVAGDIVLDADGGEVLLKDDSVTYGQLKGSTSDFIIQSLVSDKDIILKGSDAGGVITALTLDMSAAGAATFNNKVTATELDISGNIDVDGTTNLDAVDIDGAVDMASTLVVSGAVGIDTAVPSDAHGTWGQLFLGTKGSMISSSGAGGLDGTWLTDNMYVDSDTGTFAYRTTNESSAYLQEAGVHKFYVQASGSAGAGVTLAEKMRLTDAGKLGIGTTSPSQLLHISDATNPTIRITDTTNTVNLELLSGNSEAYLGTQSDHPVLFTTNNTERMRLTTAGRLGIGTTSPGSTLHLESASSPTLRIVDTTNDATLLAYAQDTEGVVGTYSNHSLGLYANSNRAMTIDANLDVGIGTTSVDAKLHVQQGGEPPAEGMLILEANSASRQLRIQPPTDSDNGFIDYRGGNLTFIDDGTEVARFQGTTSFNVSGRHSVGYTNSSSATNNGIQVLTGGIGGGVQLNRETGTPSSGESLGSYAWKGQDSANTNAAAEALIEAVATENYSGSTAATKMVFKTKATGTSPGSSPATALTLESNTNATFVGTVTCVSVTETSDAALKTNVQPIENALAAVNALQGVTYDDIETGDKRIGFIAQDVQRDAPDLAERVVLEADPETKMLGISYSHMTSVLAEAIKEQSAQIQTLKARVEELENK